MKRTITAILLAGTVMAISAAGAQAPDGARSADLGAYSREATEAARARLDDTLVVVFAGGRHGFIQGRQVSLDPEAWQTEAQVVKGKVMVPKRFALSAFGIKRLPWFGFRIAERGKMVAISDLAARLGKKVFTEERGLVIVSDTPMTLGDSQLIDSIITLFDTPEKFADPQIAFYKYFLNSVYVTLGSLVLTVILSTLGGYGFGRSRYEFKFRSWLFSLLLFALMLPPQIMYLPQFTMMSRYGLLGTRWSLILLYTATALPVSTYLMATYFSQLPSELEDAACMDGCNDFGMFWRVMLPLTRPAIATVVLINFLHF